MSTSVDVSPGTVVINVRTVYVIMSYAVDMELVL